MYEGVLDCDPSSNGKHGPRGTILLNHRISPSTNALNRITFWLMIVKILALEKIQQSTSGGLR